MGWKRIDGLFNKMRWDKTRGCSITLCLYCHIAPLPLPDFAPDLMSYPTFPPPVTIDSSSDDLARCDSWWRADSVIWHILQSCLGAGPQVVVPPCCDMFMSALTSTSYTLYNVLVAHYGGGDHSTASIIKDHLWNLVCGHGKDAVTAYITEWHAGLCRLDGTYWGFTHFDRIRVFVNHLLLTLPFHNLHECINDGFTQIPPVFPLFKMITIEVTNIMTQQHRHASLHTIPHHSALPSTSAASSTTSAPNIAATHMSAADCGTCTNCKNIGHTIEACWASGGGNVGRCEKFLATHPKLHPHANIATVEDDCYGTASCLISSHLINHASPILSNELSNTSVWLLWNSSLFNLLHLSLFGLVDIVIRFDSCLALLHTADSMPSHYFILLTLKPYPYSAKLYSYTAISLYILSFTPYLLIFLSSYLWLIW